MGWKWNSEIVYSSIWLIERAGMEWSYHMPCQLKKISILVKEYIIILSNACEQEINWPRRHIINVATYKYLVVCNLHSLYTLSTVLHFMRYDIHASTTLSCSLLISNFFWIFGYMDGLEKTIHDCLTLLEILALLIFTGKKHIWIESLQIV